jgi:4-amino-4-deoxy-L-arabinose transferase-like glycosyltransferase
MSADPQEPTSQDSTLTGWTLQLERLLLGAAILCIGVFLWVLLDFEYGRDQGIYAVVARTILAGGAPYLDAWDFKPPMIYFVYAGARSVFGAEMQGIRIVEALGFASLVFAFAILSRRHVGNARPGIIAALLAVTAHVQLEFWNTGQPESFAGVATAWALVCATRPADPSSSGRALWLAWFGAAALYTFAALCKPPLGGGILVSLGFVLHSQVRSKGRMGGWLPAISAFAAGGFFVLGGTALFFLVHGAWPALEATFLVFAPEYTALGFEPTNIFGLLYRAIAKSTFYYSAYIPLGLALLIALPRLGDGERRGSAHVALVCGFHVLGIALQAKFFAYHVSATLPLLCLLASWGLWKLWIRVRSRIPLAIVVILALLLLNDLHPGKPSRNGMSFWQRAQHRLDLTETANSRLVRGRLHTEVDVNADANSRVAAWLEQHTQETDHVFIWGFEPVIYDLSNRQHASRYIYNVPQRLAWQGRADAKLELLEALQSDPPAVFIVTRRDVFRAVTGNRLDSTAELASFEGLREFVAQSYGLEHSIEDFDIFLRR